MKPGNGAEETPHEAQPVTIYTFGYVGRSPSELETEARRLAADVLDVRFRPASQDPRWNGAALQGLPGYRWVQGFGNKNYRGGPIELKAYPAGLSVVREILKAGRTVILLCMCADVKVCHRKVVAEKLATDLRVQVEHLGRAPKPKPRTLFDEL
ncbi:MAG: DUF488 family protein [Vicinamibacterales bacterium]